MTDIRHELAALLTELGYTGVVTLVVPPPLASRLVAGYPWPDSAQRTAHDVGAMPPTVVDGLVVWYAVADLPEDRTLVRTEKAATVLLLPPYLRFAR